MQCRDAGSHSRDQNANPTARCSTKLIGECTQQTFGTAKTQHPRQYLREQGRRSLPSAPGYRPGNRPQSPCPPYAGICSAARPSRAQESIESDPIDSCIDSWAFQPTIENERLSNAIGKQRPLLCSKRFAIAAQGFPHSTSHTLIVRGVCPQPSRNFLSKGPQS